MLEDLYARAVVIDNGKEKIAMLALDICLFENHSIAERIIERVCEYTDIKKDNILVCATHLHTGAPIKNDTYLKADIPYIDMMARLAADAVTLANLRMKKMTAKYALKWELQW